jgi:pyrimidine operon attenuation protein/uracil phosphoribosyltransferase
MNPQLPRPDDLISGMATALRSDLHTHPIMIGIHTGGVWVAKRLHQSLNLTTPLGSIDINFYRDDFSRIGLHPQVKASEIPDDIEDRYLILVDDVLQTGRTIRAALNEIFSWGRPAAVQLAVLVERSGRELPIQPDVVGARLDLNPSQHIKLSGPDTLEFSVSEKPT